MRLADDEITFRIGQEHVVLRPTLRAALRLERRHGGFDRIIKAVLDGTIGVIADVIAETATTPTEIPGMLTKIGGMSYHRGLTAVTPAVLSLVYQLAGVDLEAEATDEQKQDKAAAITWGEHHARLYRIATGWLGWTPETAWNASPAEIMEAAKGRQELLGAIFGTSTNKPQDTRPLDEKVRDAFAALGTTKVTA